MSRRLSMLRLFRAPARLILPAVFLCAGLSAAAQPRPVQLRMDTGTFRYSDEASLAEVYISVGAASLRYTRSDAGTFVAAVPLHIVIRPVAASAPAGAARDAAYDQTLDYRFSVADTSALGIGQVFTEQVRTSLAPGEYEVAVAVVPNDDRVGSEARVDLSVPDYGAAQSTMLSSLQLARRIARAQDAESPFLKSGRIVQPYPDAFYGEDLPRVTYYAEAYGVPTSAPTYTVLSFLSGASSPTPIEGTQSRADRPVQPVDVLVGAVDVSALPTAEYTLHVVLLNAANEALAEQSKRVFVINPDVPQPASQVAVAEDDELLYAAMSEEELELNIQHARVIANSRERSDLNALSSDDERRAYLVRFWRNRSAASGTDARRDFYARLDRVNEQYRYGQTPGYRTDRGRVFLTYGPPSNIDRQTVNTNAAGFERWTYDNIPGEGNSEFIFVDRYNSGQMELVHSDVRGEVSLPNWEDELRN